MKKLIALALSVMLCIGLTACNSSTSGSSKSEGSTTASTPASGTSSTTSTPAKTVTGSVTASGSSALLPLAQAAAEDFMKDNKNCVVTVNGGGSGQGLKQVADGSVDIGNSDVFAEEKLDATTAATLVDHEVATLTVAAVVNADNKVKNLTTQQLIDIFTGKTTNWKDVGGDDLAIVLVTRPSTSGTRALFKKWAMNGTEEASNSALETDDSGTLLQTISDNKGSIGYVSLSYLVNKSNAKAVSIDGVDPTLENTYNGKYKVWGFEHMYTKGDGSDAAKAFIDYMKGSTFGTKLEGMGYGAISKLTDAAKSAHK